MKTEHLGKTPVSRDHDAAFAGVVGAHRGPGALQPSTSTASEALADTLTVALEHLDYSDAWKLVSDQLASYPASTFKFTADTEGLRLKVPTKNSHADLVLFDELPDLSETIDTVRELGYSWVHFLTGAPRRDDMLVNRSYQMPTL